MAISLIARLIASHASRRSPTLTSSGSTLSRGKGVTSVKPGIPPVVSSTRDTFRSKVYRIPEDGQPAAAGGGSRFCGPGRPSIVRFYGAIDIADHRNPGPRRHDPAGLRRARPGGRGEPFGRPVVRRESVHPRDPAGDRGVRGRDLPDQARGRGVETVKPAPDPDGDGDRRA